MHKSKWLAVLVLISGAAGAADVSLESARRCAGITDSPARLVCFDRAFSAAETAADAVHQAPADPPTRALGEESVKRDTTSAEAGRVSLTAKISALRETRRSVYRISLDNGQVWQQMDMDSQFVVKVGDSIEIRKGRMGGYRLGRLGKGDKAGNWVRVDRLQ
jgi:hypothetical protein